MTNTLPPGTPPPVHVNRASIGSATTTETNEPVGLLFIFGVDLGPGSPASRLQPILYTGDADELLEILTNAVTDLKATLDDTPPAPHVHCPGCNARLFGAVAARGACLGCYPKLPEGETP